jgi:hypothetical protein
MVVRPELEEDTLKRLNDQCQGLMSVNPEDVSIDKRINVVLDEYRSEWQDEEIGVSHLRNR